MSEVSGWVSTQTGSSGESGASAPTSSPAASVVSKATTNPE